MSTPSDPPTEIKKEVNALLVCNLVLLGAAIVSFLGLFFVIGAHPDQRGLLAVSAGFLGFGATIGFLFSTYGGESEKFSAVTAALHGLIGGAAITDLAKDDSIIRHIFHSLAASGNLPLSSHGLILAIAAVFSPLGFFFLYLNRKLFFNPMAHDADKKIAEAENLVAKKSSPAEPRMEKDSALAAAATTVIRQRQKKPSSNFEEQLNEGKAHYALGHNLDAVKALEAALKINPNDPDALMYLAGARARLKHFDKAEVLLEELLKNRPPPDDALRLLGYVLLFYPDERSDYPQKIRRAIEVTEKYLKNHPNDNGAKVNLACAYAQLGTDDESNVKKVRAILTPLLASSKESKDLIASLATDEGDFAKYRDLKWFIELLKD